MGKVTIEIIAKEANVSVGTVDRALNNRGRISPETRRRVLEIADRLNYHPNKAASALGRQHKLRIAAITPCTPEVFYRPIREGIEDALREIQDFGVKLDQLLYTSSNLEEQRLLFETLDDSLYDGIVLNGPSMDLTPYINKYVESGAAVITFNTDAPNSKRLFHVGANEVKSGRIAGEIMGRLMNGHGRIALLVGSFPASQARIDGFLEALSMYPDLSIAGYYACDEDAVLTYSVVDSIMKQNPDIGGIFSNSATGSVMTGAWMSDHRPARRPVLAGFDVTEPVEQYLKQGFFDVVVDQEPRRQSYNAILLMYKHLTERWLPKSDHLEIRANLVMKYNTEEHSMARSSNENIIY